jgi:hypothetical protein
LPERCSVRCKILGKIRKYDGHAKKNSADNCRIQGLCDAVT